MLPSIAQGVVADAHTPPAPPRQRTAEEVREILDATF